MTAPELSNADVLSIARELAPLVGAEWAAIPDPFEHAGSACLTRADGAAIALVQDRWPRSALGRLRISGRYPRSSDGVVCGPYTAERVAITVSLGRSRPAIARDIVRRFLPIYLAGFHETTQAIESYGESRADAVAIARQIAEAAGVAPDDQWTRKERRNEEHVIRVPEGTIRVRPYVGHPPSILVDLHGVSVDTALTIARACRPLAQLVDDVFRGGPKAAE